MSNLLCIGLGYSAEHYVAAFGHKFERIVGTMRSKERAAVLNAYDGGAPHALVFDGNAATPELRDAIAAADAALISIPQDENGDPALRVCGDALTEAQHLRVDRLSVDGRRVWRQGGGWVDEANAAADPDSARSRQRLAAERRGRFRRAPRHSGRGPAARRHLRTGTERAHPNRARRRRRIVKPGQVFNRIHVGDIAQAIDAASTPRLRNF